MRIAVIPGNLSLQLLDLFQPCDKPLQVSWQRHAEHQRLACGWMHESEVGGVQGQPRRTTVVDNRRFLEAAPILDVAADRMAQLSQMNPNLIGATGLKLTLKFGVVSDHSQTFNMRDSPLAVDSVGTAAPHAVASVTDKRCRNGLCLRLARNKTKIAPK